MNDGPIEFKDPRVTVNYHKDNPELLGKLRDLCLAYWEHGNEELICEGGLNSQGEVLSGMISCYVGFLHTAYGAENAVPMLEEMLRRIKTSDDYKSTLK